MYGFTGNYFYNMALNPNKEKDFLSDNPHLAQSEAVSGKVAESSKLADAEFAKEHQPDEMSIVSADQLKLSAKLYENITMTINGLLSFMVILAITHK